jgi:hypothetical protein
MRPTGELPDEKRVDISEKNFAALGSLAKAGQIIQ